MEGFPDDIILYIDCWCVAHWFQSRPPVMNQILHVLAIAVVLLSLDSWVGHRWELGQPWSTSVDVPARTVHVDLHFSCPFVLLPTWGFLASLLSLLFPCFLSSSSSSRSPRRVSRARSGAGTRRVGIVGELWCACEGACLAADGPPLGLRRTCTRTVLLCRYASSTMVFYRSGPF